MSCELSSSTIFLIILAVVSLLGRLLKKKRLGPAEDSAPARERSMEPAAPPEIPESMRKWLESMGIPVEGGPAPAPPSVPSAAAEPHADVEEEAAPPASFEDYDDTYAAATDEAEDLEAEDEPSPDLDAEDEEDAADADEQAQAREADKLAYHLQSADRAWERWEIPSAAPSPLEPAAEEDAVVVRSGTDARDAEHVERWVATHVRAPAARSFELLSAREPKAALLRDALVLDAMLTPARSARALSAVRAPRRRG